MIVDQTQALISSGFPLVGGGAIGFGVGYLLKKLIKLAFIALGLIALLLGCLEYQKWISVNDYVVDGDFRLATGLHLHLGDVIHLMRGGTALNILSPAIAHATNESCPPRMYLDKTLGVYHCHDAHGTHELVPANMTNQWHRAW